MDKTGRNQLAQHFQYFREDTKRNGVCTEFAAYAAYYWGQRGIGEEYGTITYPSSALEARQALTINRQEQEASSFIRRLLNQ